MKRCNDPSGINAKTPKNFIINEPFASRTSDWTPCSHSLKIAAAGLLRGSFPEQMWMSAKTKRKTEKEMSRGDRNCLWSTHCKVTFLINSHPAQETLGQSPRLHVNFIWASGRTLFHNIIIIFPDLWSYKPEWPFVSSKWTAAHWSSGSWAGHHPCVILKHHNY